MIHPEIPKSKKKTSYITGGVFALLVGIILFLLFLPSFLDKNFGFKPWDWTTIIPNMNDTFFSNVGYWMTLLIPVILFLCAVSSFFMGLSKSSGFFKGSITATSLALVLKHSLMPANLTDGFKDVLGYIALGLIIAALVLAVLGTVFRFLGDEPYVPFKANTFHFFASYALILISAIDVLAGMLNITSIMNNPNYYFGAIFGLYLVICGVWMFCTSTRDPSEFGTGYERENILQEQNKNNPQAQNQQQSPQVQQNGQIGPDGKPIIIANQNAQNQQTNPQMPPKPISPDEKLAETQGENETQPQHQMAQPQNIQQNGQMPQRPMGPNGQPLPQGMPPRPIGPDGKPLPIPPRPIGPNGQPLPQRMPPRPIGPDGRPLPIPPRPMGPNGQPLPQRPPVGNTQPQQNQTDDTKPEE